MRFSALLLKCTDSIHGEKCHKTRVQPSVPVQSEQQCEDGCVAHLRNAAHALGNCTANADVNNIQTRGHLAKPSRLLKNHWLSTESK